MASMIRSEGIWPSVKLLKTTEKNTASISMAIYWSGLISKDRQGNLEKVREFAHSSTIHIVTNMLWTNRDGRKCSYTGEVDQNGLVCGEGVAYDLELLYKGKSQFKYEFTCLNGEEHGICKLFTTMQAVLSIWLIGVKTDIRFNYK